MSALTNAMQRTATSIVLLLALVIIFYYAPPRFFSLLLLLLLTYIVAFEWKELCLRTSLQLYYYVTPLYPILPFVFFILFNESFLYRPLLFVLFITVACHDIGSYVGGKLFGIHRIVPSISPGKTWEGVFGGIFATFLSLLFFAKHSISGSMLIMFTLIISSLAFAGDLFESWLKRKAGIKDTGSLLPGHGGLLDRLDSSMAVVYFFYFFRKYLIYYF